MGNLSKKAKAKVSVNLDNTIILPGEVLNGKINIQPNNNSNITKLQNPKIEMAIFQEQNWQSFIFSQEDKTTRNGESNTNLYSNQTLNCSKFKDKMISEEITIPFQYKVPEDITPSLEWSHTRYEFASIRNFLIINIPELKYKNKILLIILKKPNYIESPLKVTAIEERKKLLLFGVGSIKVEASYPTNSFPILGNIPLKVSIDASKSDVVIKEVTVKLKRKLQFYGKNNLKSTRSFLQNMYEEKKKVCSKSEDLLFNIPFKDSNEIEYYLKSSPLGENTEICCLIPNVSTNTINVIYYIKIIADPDDLLAKKIELKLNVDFYSRDESHKNSNIFDNYNDTIKKINSGQLEINYMEPYLQYQTYNNNNNNDKRLSQFVYNHQYSLYSQNEFNSIPYQMQNQNYSINNNNNNYISNPSPPNIDEFQNNNNYYPNLQNMNTNLNNINNNYQNNLNINDNNNSHNITQFPPPPKEDIEQDFDLPTLEEIEEVKKHKEEKEKKIIENV